MKYLLLLVLILPFNLIANPLQFAWQQKTEHEWNLVDTISQSTFVFLMLIDWKQTDSVITQKETIIITGDVVDQNGNIIGSWSRNEERYTHEEQNWILGKHPSRKAVAIYNLSIIAGHTLIAYVLPNPWRKIWQTFGIGVEFYAVSTNFVAGATLRF